MPETAQQTETEVVETPATQENGGEGGGEGVSLEAPTPRKAAEIAAADKAKLESSVSGLLAKAFTKGNAEPAVSEEEKPTVVKPAVKEEESEEQTTEDDDEQQEEESEEQEAPQGAAAQQPVITPNANAPTLPAAFRRSLESRGWTKEEIDADLKTGGAKFVEMAERVHRGRNAEVADWANAGRQARAAQQQQTTQQQTQQQQPTMRALQPLDTAKLKEHYGDDKIIDAIVGPVNATIAQVNALLPAVLQVQQQSLVSQQETLIGQIDGFFGGKELQPYKEVYGEGKSVQAGSPQHTARNKVLEMADALIVGAQLQGRSLTLGEALLAAHDSFSSGYKIQAARTTIKKELKARNKGFTQKPGTRQPGNPSGLNGSRTQLEKVVGGKLAKAFA